MSLPVRILVFIYFLASAVSASAQIRVDTSFNSRELVEDVLLGEGVTLLDVRFRGARRAATYFENPSGKPNIRQGILLSTGRAKNAIGPNSSTSIGVGNFKRGDRNLERLARGKTYDAVILEFDFIPMLDSLSFNFFFASDEYVEYVNSQFNDVFAFYIRGPGFQGLTNLAVIPGTNTPITVNNVNPIKNKQYYIDNYCWGRDGRYRKDREAYLDKELLQIMEFDGMTTLLRARCKVRPGEKYTIRMAIADVADDRYDSAVFLEAKSFASVYLLEGEPISTTLPFPYGRSDTVMIPIEPGMAAKKKLQQDSLATLKVKTGRKLTFNLGTKTTTEVKSGYKPPAKKIENPATKRTLASDTIVLENPVVIQFDFDSDVVPDSSVRKLELLAKLINENPEMEIELEGHTCDLGKETYNQALSEKRAVSVFKILDGEGVSTGRLQTRGEAFRKPAVPNQGEDNRARNRRVEISRFE